LYLGRLAKDTGLKLFLNSLSSLEQKEIEFKVKFAGQGQLAEECRVRGELLGWTTGKDLENLLQESHVCFASGYLSALKSLAGGCLTVTAGETQLKRDYWLDSPFADQLFCADDHLQLEKFLSDYISQPSRFLSRIQRGHSWSRHQSWDKLSGDYQQIYLDLLN
jgi:glycosyltransferase involved in cell wall biosynthesis